MVTLTQMQHDRTDGEYNCIEFLVKGITNARRIEIYLIQLKRWCSLEEAYNLGYLRYESDGTNSYVRVYLDNATNYAFYKVWDFRCSDISGSGDIISRAGPLHAVVEFRYELEEDKKRGKDVDITWRDVNAINNYAYQIMHAIYPDGIFPDGTDYPTLYNDFTEAHIGEEICAEYLSGAVKTLHNISAFYDETEYQTEGELIEASTVRSALAVAYEYIYTDGYLYADNIFDNISYALNYWRMKVSG